mgnify:FL=1
MAENVENQRFDDDEAFLPPGFLAKDAVDLEALAETMQNDMLEGARLLDSDRRPAPRSAPSSPLRGG